MKAIQQTDTAQKLMGEVRLARLNLAKAESQLVEAKEQARLARRRRKEAKQAARRTKKRVREAKENVAGAKLAVAKLEGTLARPKPAKVKPRRTPAKKVPSASRRKSLVAAVDAQPCVTIKIRKPVALRTRFKRKHSPTGKAAKKSITVPGDLETPVVMIPPEVSKATSQIVKGGEKIFSGEIQTEVSVETAAQTGIAARDNSPSMPNQNLNSATINT